MGSVQELKDSQTNHYDLIVSDNMLGDGDFDDIAKVIYNSINIKTPIIIYTGTVEKLDKQELNKRLNVLELASNLR